MHHISAAATMKISSQQCKVGSWALHTLIQLSSGRSNWITMAQFEKGVDIPGMCMYNIFEYTYSFQLAEREKTVHYPLSNMKLFLCKLTFSNIKDRCEIILAHMFQRGWFRCLSPRPWLPQPSFHRWIVSTSQLHLWFGTCSNSLGGILLPEMWILDCRVLFHCYLLWFLSDSGHTQNPKMVHPMILMMTILFSIWFRRAYRK